MSAHASECREEVGGGLTWCDSGVFAEGTVHRGVSKTPDVRGP